MDKIFFIDVDNTLLDNDHIKEDIKRTLVRVLGETEANEFWRHHDEFRSRTKLVDFPNIIREHCKKRHPKTCKAKLNDIFEHIEFRHAVFPKVPEVLSRLREIGKVIILSEGDAVYQRNKIDKSGIAAMADGVLLLEHKLDRVPELCEKYAGDQPVFIDDKANFLAQVKRLCPRAYTIEVCQGHYCSADHSTHEKLDKTINSISELLVAIQQT